MADIIKFPAFKHNIVTGHSLNVGSPNKIRDPFPLGEGWYRLLLHFTITLANTTGTTPITDGLLKFIKNIQLKCDFDDLIVNACAKALYLRSLRLWNQGPFYDAASATAGVYHVFIPIDFANRRMRRPEDTILNTARYRSVELSITLGTVADILSVVGDSAVTVTLNATVEKSQFPVDTTNMPIMLPYIVEMPPVNPTNQQYIDIERSPDLAILELIAMSQNSATAGESFTGAGANTVITSLAIEDNKLSPFRSIPFLDLHYDNRQKLQLATDIAGLMVFNFCEDDSIASAYPTGDKSLLRFKWTNDTLSTSQISMLMDGVKVMK